MHKGSNEYLHLPRNVVSVESHGRLKVVTHAYYSKSDGKAQESQVDIPAKNAKQCHRCSLGKCELVVLLLGLSLSRRSWTCWWIAQR